MSILNAVKSSFSPTDYNIKKRDIVPPQHSVKFQKELRNTSEKRQLLNQATILAASQQEISNTPNLYRVEHSNPVIKNLKSPIKNHGCKFKATDKLLVVSVDDLDSKKSNMNELSNYLKQSKTPATLFPHIDADQNILKEMKGFPNTKQGWHGVRPKKLDAKPLPGTDKSVIAWSHGVDGEGRKKSLGSNAIARGTRCAVNDYGIFDQHQMNSCSLNDNPNPNLKKVRNKVLNNGGILSVHLHKSEGLTHLKETVSEFNKKGGKIVHFNQLKGCGK